MMLHSQRLQAHPKSAIENKVYYRPDIDGLRGVAVGLVILYHLFPGTFKNGFLGVDVFFVISGFVVTQALQRNLVHGFFNGLVDFYAHRIKRILPALYFNIIVSITLSCLLIPPSDLQSIFKTAAAAVAGISNIALLYARFDYFSTALLLNPFVQTWSLGVEEQFYFVFPSLLIFGSYLTGVIPRFKVIHWPLAFAALSLIYWVYLVFNAPVAAFYNPVARFWEFLIGAILCLNKSAIVAFIDARISVLLQYLAVASLVIGLSLSPNYAPLNYFANIFVVLGSALIIAAGVAPSSRLNSILGSELLVWTGKLSYSLYLWHYPIFTFARWNYDLDDPLYALLAMLLTVSVSYFSYRFIEIPFRYASIKGASAILRGAGVGAASLLFVYALYLLPPSRIYLGHAERYADLWPPAASPLTKSLSTSRRTCHLEYRDHLSKDLFDRCSTPRKGGNFIYLMGNSEAQSLVPMLETASRNLGYGYAALTISNCRLISAFQFIGSINQRYDLCKNYFDYSREFVIENAKSGDIVLIGARSLLDKPTPSSTNMPSGAYIDGKQLSAKEAYEKSIADFSAFSSILHSKGVYLIFAGPTPSYNIPATQCVPEWFRVSKANCKVTLNSLLIEKAGYVDAVSEIAAKSNNGYLWDPLAALCDDANCYPFKGDKLVIRDEQHLSVYGSQSLAPGFIEIVNGIKGASFHPVGKHD